MTPTRPTVAAVALVVVVATAGALWGVGAYRESLDRGAGTAADAATAPTSAAQQVTPVPRPTPTTVAPDRSATPRPTRVTVAAVTTARPPPAKDAEPAASTTASGPTTAVPRTVTTPNRTTTTRPLATTAPPDYDGDGIPDAADRCPTRPETVNGFRDGDGCPDVVATTRAS